MKKFLALSLILFLTACQGGAPSADLEQVMEVKKEVDLCLERVKAIDMEDFQSMYDQVKEEKSFMNLYNRDTIAQVEAIFIGNYFRYMKKRMARILKGQERMVKDLDKTSTQLSDLHDAMKRGDHSEVEWKAYMSTEKSHATRDLTLGNEMADDFAAVTERFNQDHTQVVEYVAVHRENAKDQ